MKSITRRKLLQRSALLAAAARSGTTTSQAAPPAMSTYEWIRSTRILIAEAYNPPFYPALDYQPEKAVRIAREFNADSLRYPSASHFAYFLPVTGVKTRIRVGRAPKSVSLLRSGEKIAFTQNGEFMELTVPRVLIHEAVRVDLA